MSLHLARGQQPPAQPPPRGLHLRTRDFDEMTLAFRGWDARFTQLSRGPFVGEVQLLPAGGVQIMRLAYNRVIQARGTPRLSQYLFSLVGAGNANASWRGQTLAQGDVNVFHPGDVMDHKTSAAADQVTLIVDPDTLRKSAAVLHGLALDDKLLSPFGLRPSSGAHARLDALLRRWLLAAEHRPDLLAHADGARWVEQTCLRRLLQAIAPALPVTPAELGPNRRRQVARRAEEFMLAHLHAPLTIFDLCAATDVSERTLRNAFQEAFDLSPMAYLKTRRLHGVRQELKAADPRHRAVHEIAQRWCFWHTGNFAADYRRLFGEAPSETLASSS